MHVVIVFSHPNENSFGASIMEHLIQGLKQAQHTLTIHNLYEDKFNPVMTKEELLEQQSPAKDPLLKRYQNDILKADVLAFIHPCWWYCPPAILKGYFDRVLEKGFAYDYQADEPVPLLKNINGLVIQTFDAEEKMEKEFYDDITFKTIKYTLNYCGISNIYRYSVFRIVFSSFKQRATWLEKVKEIGLTLEEKYRK
jgi:NAD(P)H dehydrogenase (quinone)